MHNFGILGNWHDSQSTFSDELATVQTKYSVLIFNFDIFELFEQLA